MIDEGLERNIEGITEGLMNGDLDALSCKGLCVLFSSEPEVYLDTDKEINLEELIEEAASSNSIEGFLMAVFLGTQHWRTIFRGHIHMNEYDPLNFFITKMEELNSYIEKIKQINNEDDVRSHAIIEDYYLNMSQMYELYDIISNKSGKAEDNKDKIVKYAWEAIKINASSDAYFLLAKYGNNSVEEKINFVTGAVEADNWYDIGNKWVVLDLAAHLLTGSGSDLERAYEYRKRYLDTGLPYGAEFLSLYEKDENGNVTVREDYNTQYQRLHRAVYEYITGK